MQRRFECILENDFINNCPVTLDDAKRAEYIFGDNPASLKATTTRERQKHVPSIPRVMLPSPILEFHKDVTLCMDFFFFQGNPFLHSISRKIKFRTVTPTPKRGKETIMTTFNGINKMYSGRGFVLDRILADNKFECIRDEVSPISLNIAAAGEHVSDVERSVRTVKNQVRSMCHGMPYKRLLKELVKGLVRVGVSNLNMFPNDDGVSKVLSPLTIVTGKGNEE